MISLKGNTDNGSGGYLSDYDIAEVFAELGLKANGVPVSIFGNHVVNTAAEISEDTGWLFGIKINKAANTGDWAFSYNYRDIDVDAVIGGLNDSDFSNGGTGGKGHKFGVKYQCAKNVQAALTHFDNQKGSEDVNYNRTQADLIFKF